MRIIQNAPPAVDLMFSCLQVDAAQLPDLPAEVSEHIRQLVAAGIEARLLLEMTQWQRVTPLVWSVVTAAAPGALAGAGATEIEAAVRKNAYWNVFLARRLLRLATVFAQNGIELLAYKGPALAVQAYGQLSLRQFSDLDILVRQEAFQKARALLFAEGFRQVWPANALTPAQEERHWRAKYNVSLYQPADQITLELHWSVTPNYLRLPANPADLWNAVDEVVLNGQPLRTFAPSRMLLILCIHGANHCWLRLNWVCDVAQLIRRNPNLDWQAVMGEAQRWGCGRILHLGLRLADALLGVELPDSVHQALAADREANQLAAQAARRLTRYPSYWLGPFEEPVFHLRMRERLADRMRYGLAMSTPTPADWEYVTLPEALAPLYYLVRPVRLFLEHGLKLRHEGHP